MSFKSLEHSWGGTVLLMDLFFKCYCQGSCECWRENEDSVSWIYGDGDLTFSICAGNNFIKVRMFLGAFFAFGSN